MQGYEKALKIDASRNMSETDKDSVSRNYPLWQNARSSYGKRRQQENADYNDPYNLPEKLKLTHFGFIKLEMGKEISENDRFELIIIIFSSFLERWLLHSNKEMGIIIFATEMQLHAANWCSILVCDATFDVAPKGFYQLYTIHGLVGFGFKNGEIKFFHF